MHGRLFCVTVSVSLDLARGICAPLYRYLPLLCTIWRIVHHFGSYTPRCTIHHGAQAQVTLFLFFRNFEVVHKTPDESMSVTYCRRRHSFPNKTLQAQVPICAWLMAIPWCVTLSGCWGWLLRCSNYFLYGDIGLFWNGWISYAVSCKITIKLSAITCGLIRRSRQSKCELPSIMLAEAVHVGSHCVSCMVYVIKCLLYSQSCYLFPYICQIAVLIRNIMSWPTHRIHKYTVIQYINRLWLMLKSHGLILRTQLYTVSFDLCIYYDCDENTCITEIVISAPKVILSFY